MLDAMFMKERCQCKVNLGIAHIEMPYLPPCGRHQSVTIPKRSPPAYSCTSPYGPPPCTRYSTALYCKVLYCCTVPAVGVGAALGALGVVSDTAAAVDNAGVLASPRTTRIQTIAPTLLPSSAPLFIPPSLPFAFALDWTLIVIGAWKKS